MRRWSRWCSWLVLVLMVALPLAVWAQSVGWDAAFEAQPDPTRPVSEGDDRIRELKTATRERGDVEIRWDSVNQAPQTNDNSSGRLRPGASRTFMQPGAPTGLLSNDALGSPALDDGRLWVETDPGTTRSVTTGGLRLYVRDETNTSGLGAGWHNAIALPQNAIILWDQMTGDVNCDGIAVPNECPCGFTEATEFRGLLARGADVAAANTAIPNGPGVSCSAAGAPAGCDADGGGQAARYNDVLETTELAAHTHTVDTPSGTNDSAGPPRVADTSNTALSTLDQFNTGSTGSGTVHTHPFRTVLFCRAR